MNNCWEYFTYCICIYEVEDRLKFKTVKISCICVLFVYSCPASESIKLSSSFFEGVNFEFRLGLILVKVKIIKCGIFSANLLVKVVCIGPKRLCLHDIPKLTSFISSMFKIVIWTDFSYRAASLH